VSAVATHAVQTKTARRVERVKAAVRSHLGDLGELAEDDEDACLPSGKAWVAFVQGGDVGALGSALTHTGIRAALIGTGLWLAGAEKDTLVRDSVAGSLGVDAFIFLWSLCRSEA